MNVFSVGLMDALENLLDEVSARSDIRGVVLTSGKPAFIAGADLEMVRRFTDEAVGSTTAALDEICGRLGRLFRRLEVSAKPFVAAIHGGALGGGLELALACHGRVLTDDKKTCLGLPEVKLGLLPGAGGTQRLPRLVGGELALRLLLSGESISGERALESGLVDAVVFRSDLISKALALADRLARDGAIAPWDREDWCPGPEPIEFSQADPTNQLSIGLGISKEALTCYPAYRAIVECVAGGWRLGMEDACRWEMECFIRLIRSPVAGNMVRSLFLNRQRATKVLPTITPDCVQVTVGEGSESARKLLSGFARIRFLEPGCSEASAISLLMQPGHLVPPFPGLPVAWLRNTENLEHFGLDIGIWVSDVTEHGQAVEVCVRGGSSEKAAPLLDLAKVLRATPMISTNVSLLESLNRASRASARLPLDDRLLSMGLVAAHVWQQGAISDTAIADSCAVVSGVFPAFAGGPFTYLRQTGLDAVAMRFPEVALSSAVPPSVLSGLQDLLSARCGRNG
jgi:3-hydroxyacyl-CoA dehydrogenase/enoyl-CoA hydratase/3-hydroxybutyryl-CoA epimerase